ncbi:MAG TPA: HEAT repeat domain-containing protein [Herpetosiphonaceae bacterium]
MTTDSDHTQIAALIQRLQESPNQWLPAAKALGALGAVALPALLALDDHADAALRSKIAYALGAIDDPRARARLLRHLADPHPKLRSTAAWVSGNCPHLTLRDPLLRLLADQDAMLRSSAVHSLRNFGGDILPALLPWLRHAMPHARAAAAQVLSGTADPAAQALLQPLLDDSSTVVVAAAVDALATPGRDDLLLRVTAMLAAPEPSLRMTAAHASGTIGNPQVVGALLPLLHDPDQDVVTGTITALSQLRDAQSVAPLLELVLAAEALDYRAMTLGDRAGAALVTINSPQVVAPLLRHAGRRAWFWYGREIIRALGAEAIPDLLIAIDDPAALVRERAALLLGELGAQQALPQLLRALTDAHPALRHSAATALGRLQAAAAMAPLCAALAHDPALEVRIAAATALGTMGMPAAGDPLARVIETTDGALRWAAVRALATLRDPRALAPLVAATATDDAARCAEALDGLGALGDARAVHLALTLVAAPDVAVGRSAINCLGALGDQRAVAPLIAALSDPDDTIRLAACYALGALGAPEALSPLQWVADHDQGWTDPPIDCSVAYAAEQAIAQIQAGGRDGEGAPM